MTKEAAIYNFWSQFEWKAYEENTIPSDASFPYITYQLVTGSFGALTVSAVSLWTLSDSWIEINRKAEDIAEFIGLGGVIIKCDNGRIWIKQGTPFAQNLKDDTNDLIKRKYLNVETEFLTTY